MIQEIFLDETLKRAIIRSLEIIGEATKRLDTDFTAVRKHVEWKKMAATRDIMIHHYFGIDYDIVWSIITGKLPDLEYYIKQIIDEVG
ncbi:MAG TPA: HepT-like ribonuclease domain-containing protein [Cytophagales bacterium]|nr:HepT-like ribonuclease domain-containing protein [Cytophagales bacterium]